MFFNLIGLCFDLVGAFLLAAEAIGLETIRSWQEKAIDRPIYILGISKAIEMDRRADEMKLSWLPSAAIGLASGIGGAAGLFMALSFKQLGLPSWVPYLGILVGGIAGAFFIDLIVFLLRSASRFFVWIQDSAGKGTIGLTGFVLLAIGFLLQFIGGLSKRF